MASIEYRGLTKRFADGTVAVDAFDLEIADGEFVVLVGPSGSGKTTVLRMTAGLEDPTDGDIVIGGARVNEIPPMDRNIAMVFQNYALYPHMNVYDNMAFGLKLHKVKKDTIRERVESTAKMLAIDELLKRKPSQLSGGQRQRVAMGRAIVREPDAFLMDEPLSNLDAKLRVEMRAHVSLLHHQLRTTTVYVTHDQTEAMTMGDRVAVMRGGVLEQCDAPRRLYDRPVNAENGGLQVVIGDTSLRLPDSVLRARSGLQDRAGHDVVVGIRPEDIEDAALLGSQNGRATLDVRVALVESTGAEVIAHFPVDAETVAAADGEGRELITQRVGPGETTLTARLSPRTRAQTGEPLRVAIDASRLHFFDVNGGHAIW
jgi:multiple sugar transport system ATP-binding protein